MRMHICFPKLLSIGWSAKCYMSNNLGEKCALLLFNGISVMWVIVSEISVYSYSLGSKRKKWYNLGGIVYFLLIFK